MGYRYTSSKAVTGLLVYLIMLTHCAGPQVAAEKETAALKNRINEYWQYVINGDIEKAYQCEIPASREKMSILQYALRYKLFKYFDAEVTDVQLSGKEAKSSSTVTYVAFLKGMTGKRLKKAVDEQWVKVKGTWYHIPEGFEMKKSDSKA